MASARSSPGLLRWVLPPLDSRGFWPRYWLLAAGAWAAASFIVVPLVIRGTHRGLIPFLGRLMSGRADSDVSEYLALWSDRIPSISFVYATLAILAAIVLLIRRQPRLNPIEPGQPHVDGMRWNSIILVALWVGLVTGLGESYYLLGRVYLLGLVPPGFRQVSPDSLWMAPVATTATMLGIGAILASIGRLSPRLASKRVVLAVLLFVMFDTWIRVTDRLTFWSTTLLALGLAFQTARYVAPKAAAFRSLLRRTVPPLVGAVVAIAAIVTVPPIVRERRELADLGPAPAEAMNVLLIVLDTQRAASTSLYGSDRETTPQLDRWAESGVTFDRAFSPAPWTLPSHAVLFTGRYNFELGTDYFSPLDDRFPTLAETLKNHGYRTGGFVANLLFGNPMFGLGRGFIRYDVQPRSIGMIATSSSLTRGWGYRARMKLGNHRPFVRRRAEAITEDLIDWLDDDQSRPFFAFLNLFDAHDPYLPPAPFDTIFAPPRAQYWTQGGGAQDESASYTAETIEEMRAMYESGIAYQDHYVGHLLDELDVRGLLEETIVIVTADHGEEFGEHGWMLHGDDLYFPQIHVPLVVWLPGGPEGLRISAPVGLRDVAATLLDALDLEHELPGRSLLPGIVTGSVGGGHDWAPALSQLGVRHAWSLVQDRYHYILDADGGEHLYDYLADPAEQVDLVGLPTHGSLLKEFRSYLAVEAGVEFGSGG